MNWAEDRFETPTAVTFAANMGAGTGADLNASANNAIAAAFALSGGGASVVAAQFTFGGRTYLAIDQARAGAFVDADDLLLDITGVDRHDRGEQLHLSAPMPSSLRQGDAAVGTRDERDRCTDARRPSSAAASCGAISSQATTNGRHLQGQRWLHRTAGRASVDGRRSRPGASSTTRSTRAGRGLREELRPGGEHHGLQRHRHRR